ncbi:MAG: PhnD/SsuA/transferrin family substrate-binding protein [Cyanobacteria bacterium P01_H01_bin.153]
MKRRHFITYSLLFAAGCSASTVSQGKEENSQGDRPDKLRFAVTDVQGLESLEADYGPFRAALESLLDLPIEFFPVENLVAATPALLSGKVDLVFAGPSEYLILRARAAAEPIVAVTRPDYYSVMVVKADSDLQALPDLKGKTIAMRAEGSTASHIWSTKLLMDAGLTLEDFQIEMLGDGGLEALLAGNVDAWTDANARVTRFIEAAGVENQVRSLIQGEELPNDVFVARSTLNADFVQEVQMRMIDAQAQLLEALVAAPANSKYQQSAFVTAADASYDDLRAAYRAIGQESLIQ